MWPYTTGARWHISQPMGVCLCVRVCACYTGATVGGVSQCVKSWLCSSYLHNVHGPRQCGLAVCFCLSLDVRMLVGVVHMNRF